MQPISDNVSLLITIEMKYFIVCLCFIAGQSAVLAQSELEGTVRSQASAHDSAHVLIGATIRWLGTNTGCISNKEGHFHLPRVAGKSLLVVSFVGYMSDTLNVPAGTKTIDVQLKADKQLSEIHVEAATQSISNAPIKTESIGKHQLERSACCSLAESFEKSPSVEVSFSDAATGAKTIQLLGLRGVYTLTMTDVIPLVRGLASPFGLDYIPGPFIDNISISKGAASVMNGYEGITGQINAEYKRPTMDIPLLVNLYGNTTGRLEANVTTAQQLSDTWSLGVMAHTATMHIEHDQNNDGFLDTPHNTNYNALVHLVHEGESGTEFQFLAKVVSDELESGTAENSTQEHTNHAFAVQTHSNRAEFYTKYAINPLVEDPEIRMGLQIAGAKQRLQTLIGSRDYNGDEDYLYSKLIFTMDATETLKLAYGVSMYYDRMDDSFDPIVPKDSVLHFLRTESVPGVFAEATYSPNDQWTFVGGLRADHHNLFGSFITPRFHLRYAPSDALSLRLSAGEGTRVANVLSDNLSSLVNQRAVIIGNDLQPERAWNYGVSGSYDFSLFGSNATLDAEFYRTQFINQIVVDMDASVRSVTIDNLHGQSYSNSALVQLQCSPLSRLDLSLAYRLIDAKVTTGGVLQERPLISPHRVLFTAGYSTDAKLWQFDATFIWNSGGRIPLTTSNPEEYHMSDHFDSYLRINAQVTRRFHDIDVYAGVENLTNFIQQQAVISPLDPHSTYFDASLVWGPLEGRFVYLGLRWHIDH